MGFDLRSGKISNELPEEKIRHPAIAATATRIPKLKTTRRDIQ